MDGALRRAIPLCVSMACCGSPGGARDVDGAAGSNSGGQSSASGGSGGSTASTGGASSGGAAGLGGTATGGSSNPTYPAELLDLTNWKLTLPVADTDGFALEILQPELAKYTNDPYFHLDSARTGVLFRAHCGGATTSGSGYPRSELREMTNAGQDLAAWSTTSGTHTMRIDEAIVHLPVAKPHVVAGQIHDASDDVVMIRLENEYLFVEGGGNDLGALDSAYVLGAPFTVELEASGGHIRIYYDDLTTPKVDVQRDATGCYFKAGDYTQSNIGTGDDPAAYGEVVITSLSVTHQ